ncbi:hypothetical protein [Streptomyces werraensis]|uniref:hypothetical protein n=1 Tax=Streptomyces werraensis TaxID=68284 RepID=UPI00367AF615
MNQPTEPIRKSSLPTTPPPEWEFFTFFPYPEEDGGDMVRGQRQRGVQVRRLVTYGDWEPVRPDRWADEPDTAVSSAGQAPATNHTAELEQLRTENARMRHELEVMYGGAFDSLKPAPTDPAAVYAEVADRLAADAEHGDKEGLTRIYRRSAAKQVHEWGEELRRLADETPESDPACAHCGGNHAWDNCEAYSALVAAETPAGATDGPAAGARQDGDQPSLRDHHRATWQALTPDQQTARLAELDTDDDQDGADT